MIRADRWVIAAVVFLTAGLWTLFNFCHGDAGLAFALPISGSKVSLNLTTMGWPVLVGIPLTLIGALLLVAAVVVALMEQFIRHGNVHAREKHNTEAVQTRPNEVNL